MKESRRQRERMEEKGKGRDKWERSRNTHATNEIPFCERLIVVVASVVLLLLLLPHLFRIISFYIRILALPVQIAISYRCVVCTFSVIFMCYCLSAIHIVQISREQRWIHSLFFASLSFASPFIVRLTRFAFYDTTSSIILILRCMRFARPKCMQNHSTHFYWWVWVFFPVRFPIRNAQLHYSLVLGSIYFWNVY